jgi:tetraprenyl-beta-curcumene synthase
MTTAIQTGEFRGRRPPAASAGHGRTGAGHPRPRSRAAAADRVRFAGVFAVTVLNCLFRVLPHVARERAHWRELAAAIPNPRLRRHALRSLGKRGNIEGAALFATLVPSAHRRSTVRALVAYQTAYNYLDALSELPSPDPVANGRRLHQALLTALRPGAGHPDYYAYNPDGGSGSGAGGASDGGGADGGSGGSYGGASDGGYLAAIVDACADALAALPSFPAIAPAARAAAARIVDFQALNLAEAQGGHDGLGRWAGAQTPAGSGLGWWETAAAAGSSLAVHALITAAAKPAVRPSEVVAIERVYFPWAGALHSLLDSLVDRGEDHERGQRSLLDYYGSPAQEADRLALLAKRAVGVAAELPDRHAHRVIVTAMCSYYLSAPRCDTAEGRSVAGALAEALGSPLRVAVLMFRVRRLLHTLGRRAYT